jgi:hypothetical protein
LVRLWITHDEIMTITEMLNIIFEA